jgi:hypothetical protein
MSSCTPHRASRSTCSPAPRWTGSAVRNGRTTTRPG